MQLALCCSCTPPRKNGSGIYHDTHWIHLSIGEILRSRISSRNLRLSSVKLLPIILRSPHLTFHFLFYSFEFMMKHLFLSSPYYYLYFIIIYIYIIILNVRLSIESIEQNVQNDVHSTISFHDWVIDCTTDAPFLAPLCPLLPPFSPLFHHHRTLTFDKVVQMG